MAAVPKGWAERVNAQQAPKAKKAKTTKTKKKAE